MGITYRQGHEGRLSIQEMDNNFHFIENYLTGLTNSVASLKSLELGLSASLDALATLEHLDVAGLTASVLTLNTNLASATASIVTLNTNLASATASIVTLNTNLATATASILGLSMSIDNISLTPGPTGPKGATGINGNDGAQGPEGPQGIEGPVGVSGLTWQGAWSNNSLYNKNDAVGWASASWWCVATVSSTASVVAPDLDTTHINWTLLAAQGSQGPMGAQGIQGPTGPQGIQGPTGSSGTQTFTTESLGSNTNSAPFPFSDADFAMFVSSGVTYALPIAQLGDVKYIRTINQVTLYASPNPGIDGANNNFLMSDGNGNSSITLLAQKSYRFTYTGRYGGTYGYWVAEVMNNL